MFSNMSIIGIMEYDSTVFDNLHLPEGMTFATMVDYIVNECAELELLYPDASYLKTVIGSWSAARLPSWEKLYAYYNVIIDPENEYDFERKRTPDLKYTKSGSEADTQTGSIGDSGNNDRTADLTVTASVSAYNSNTYENRDQTKTSGTDKYSIGNTRTFNNYANTKTFTNRQDAESGTDTVTEKGHRSDLARLIQSAIALSVNNMYELITEEFKEKFCLLVY